MHVLITGGAGFNGARLALHLRGRGHRVTVLDNLVRRGSELNLAPFRRHGIEFVHGDVRNREDFAALPAVDLICETSAQASAVTGYANPHFDFSNNTFGLLNTLEYARSCGAALIFWSTNRVYSADRINAIPRREEATRLVWDYTTHSAKGSGANRSSGGRGNGHSHISGDGIAGYTPGIGFSEKFSVDGGCHSIYGLSKLMADLACQEYADAYGVKTVINRFGVISGEGQFGKSEQGWGVWWAIAHYFGLPLRYIGWGGKQVRDVVFIADVCRLIELEAENIQRISGEVFNIGGGMSNTISLLECTALLEQKTGRRVPATFAPEPRKADFSIYATDTRKAERLLNWRPQIGMIEGYDRILDWIQENERDLRELYVAPQPASAELSPVVQGTD